MILGQTPLFLDKDRYLGHFGGLGFVTWLSLLAHGETRQANLGTDPALMSHALPLCCFCCCYDHSYYYSHYYCQCCYSSFSYRITIIALFMILTIITLITTIPILTIIILSRLLQSFLFLTLLLLLLLLLSLLFLTLLLLSLFLRFFLLLPLRILTLGFGEFVLRSGLRSLLTITPMSQGVS